MKAVERLRCGSPGVAAGALVAGAVSLGALGGCASPGTTPVSLGAEGSGHLITCEGFRLSAADCIEAANEVCADDYDVLATTGEWYRGGSAVTGLLDHVDRGMVIQCRGEPDADAEAETED